MELSPRATRILILSVVVVAVVGAVVWALAGNGTEDQDPDPEPDQADRVDVSAWFLWSEEEYQEAGAVAVTAAEAVTEVDSGEDPEDRHARLTEVLGEDAADSIAASSSAASGWEELVAAGLTESGRARVDHVRHFDERSITLVVDVLVTSETPDGTDQREEEWAVTVTPDDGGWSVYHVAPADVGDAGDIPAE